MSSVSFYRGERAETFAFRRALDCLSILTKLKDPSDTVPSALMTTASALSEAVKSIRQGHNDAVFAQLQEGTVDIFNAETGFYKACVAAATATVGVGAGAGAGAGADESESGVGAVQDFPRAVFEQPTYDRDVEMFTITFKYHPDINETTYVAFAATRQGENEDDFAVAQCLLGIVGSGFIPLPDVAIPEGFTEKRFERSDDGNPWLETTMYHAVPGSMPLYARSMKLNLYNDINMSMFIPPITKDGVCLLEARAMKSSQVARADGPFPENESNIIEKYLHAYGINPYTSKVELFAQFKSWPDVPEESGAAHEISDSIILFDVTSQSL